ncbi:MAG: US12 family protein [Epsilonproteobacteria bacterium]|nr:US12 family protein [Campylobacterota bacterium]
MKRFFVFLLLAYSQVLLHAKGCGSDNWKAYSCPSHPNNDQQYGYLSELDIKNGKALCTYSATSSKSEDITVTTDCNKEYEKDAADNRGDAILAENQSKLEAYIGQIKGRKVEFDPTYLATLSKAELDKLISNVMSKNAEAKKAWEAKYNDFVKTHPIDSHTEYTKTLSSVLMGTFTLDPDFFEEGYINDAGEAVIKKEFNILRSEISDSGFWSDVVSFFTGEESSDKATIEYISPLDFADRQVLGYYILTIEALKKIFSDIVMTMFALGMLYSSGYYLFRKMFEKYGTEPFQTNALSFFSTAMIAILFFSAPVFNDGDIKDSGFSTNINVSSAETQKIENWSSIAQKTIRIGVQTGTYLANRSSDYVMAIYFSLLAKKSGFIDIDEQRYITIGEKLSSYEVKKVKLIREVAFYEDICRPYFNYTDTQLFPKEKSAQINQNNYGVNENILKQENVQIETDRLLVGACSKLEGDISSDLQETLISYVTLKDELERYRDLMNTSGNSANSLMDFLALLQFGQNHVGWGFISAIPVSYFFLDNAEIFLYDEVTKDNSGSYAKGLENAQQENKDKLGSEADGFVETVMDEALEGALNSGLVTNSYWFLVPGFSELYKMVKGIMSDIFITDPEKAKGDTEEGKSWMKRLVSFITSKLSSGLSYFGPVGKMISGTMSLIAAGSSYLVGIAALYLSVIVATFMVSAVTMMTISAFLVLQIIMLFVETIFFFFSSMVIGIYYAFMAKGGTKNHLGHFLTSLFAISFSPVLMVITASLLIPVAMTFKGLFGLLMSLIVTVIDNASESMTGVLTEANNSDAGLLTQAGNSIQSAVMISGINGMTMIFSLFATLIISLILIYNYKSWFLKLVGVDGGLESLKESSQEMKQSVGGKVINPVG